MNFMMKLEKKLGKYSIRNLPLYMLITYAVGYLMQVINPNIALYLSLNPEKILHGQVWRIISWVLIPPGSSNLFFVLIMLYFYYSLGRMLEATWGTFYFNYYIFSGLLFTILGAFTLYGITELYLHVVLSAPQAAQAAPYITEQFLIISNNWDIVSLSFSTYYVNMSIFLAYAATYPDMRVMLMFIIPIKVKVLGIIYGIMLCFEAINGGLLGFLVIGPSLLNFIIFFFTYKNRGISKQQKKRAKEYKMKMKPLERGVTNHKCVICGRTNITNPELEFRFCSKCEGVYEFCSDHLFTHSHFKGDTSRVVDASELKD